MRPVGLYGGERSKLVIVTHEYPPFAGGIATYCRELAAAAAARGIPTEIIAPHYDEGDDDVDGTVPVRRLLSHHRLSPLAVASTLSALRRRAGTAFLHAADIRSTILVYLATRGTAHPAYAATVHGSDASKLDGGSIGVRLARRAYAGAATVFANSEATKGIFQRNMPAAVAVRTTYLGLNADWLRPAEPAFRSPSLNDFTASGTIVSTVGRVEPRKGQLNAIRALALLRTAGSDDVRYVVAGPIVDADYAAQLVDAANALEVPMLLAGKLDQADVRRIYAISRCHVLPAIVDHGRIEGFGLSLLEAAAQGCPSVASRLGGIPEALVDGVTGILCAEGDIADLSRAIAAITDDPALRARLAAHAVANAQSFTWDRCARDSYGDIFGVHWHEEVDARSDHERDERQRLARLEETVDQAG